MYIYNIIYIHACIHIIYIYIYIYIYYINDLSNVYSILKFALFADNSNIFYSVDSLELLSNIIGQEGNSELKWNCFTNK